MIQKLKYLALRNICLCKTIEEFCDDEREDNNTRKEIDRSKGENVITSGCFALVFRADDDDHHVAYDTYEHEER